MTFILILIIVSEYDQEIPQSHTKTEYQNPKASSLL